jgi:hypothetical protein
VSGSAGSSAGGLEQATNSRPSINSKLIANIKLRLECDLNFMFLLRKNVNMLSLNESTEKTRFLA